jgi:hypothetical protein
MNVADVCAHDESGRRADCPSTGLQSRSQAHHCISSASGVTFVTTVSMHPRYETEACGGVRPLDAARGALIALLGRLIAMLTAQNADLVLLADTALSTPNPASGPRSRILTPRTIEDKF